MPKVQASFADVKSGFGVLPTADYRCKVEAVEYDPTARNPFHTITMVVDDPEQTDFNNQKVWDRIYMNKKDGTVNSMSLGRLKQYAEAILGEEAANGTELDTDDFVDGHVIATIEVEPWENKEKGTSGESNRVKRVSPAE